MGKIKTRYIPNLKNEIKKEETLTEILKEYFKLMTIRSNVRSNLHLSIAVGDHESTHKNAIELNSLNEQMRLLKDKIKMNV